MKLSEWFTKPDAKKSKFADRIGLTPSAVTQLCNGDFEPRLRTAVAIEDATGGEVTVRELLKDDPQVAQ